MPQTAREEIFKRLRREISGETPIRPEMPLLNEISMNRKDLVDRFSEMLLAQAAIVHHVKNEEAAKSKLSEILKEEKVRIAMASTDTVVSPMNLPDWGKALEVVIKIPGDYADRESFKDNLFNDAEAGITGADYGIAESGTLALIHDNDQARLISLAPVLHIVILPVERIVPIYEEVVEAVYGKGERPSQLTFITGPSMTADIQAASFRGMHGPGKVIVILVG